MEILSEHQRRILELARVIWDNQHENTLDTVDGTFYWIGCRWDLFVQLLDEANRDPGAGHGRLANAIPGVDLSRLGRPVYEHRVPVRGAVTEVVTQHSSGPTGVVKRTIVTAKVRNAQWVGADVADAVHGAWDKYQEFWPADLWDQHCTFLALSPPEHVVVEMRLGPERRGRLLDYSEEDTFQFGPDETHVRFTYKPTPDWDYEPSIEVEVSAPPPAKSVIAAWFDGVAVDTYGWPSLLSGAKNRQDVATAIRTWTAALLIAAGRRQRRAFGDVEVITGNEFPSNSVFYENRDLLLRKRRSRS